MTRVKMSLERVVLDTNIVIDLFAGDPAVAEAILAKRKVFLPVPALGELYRGAFESTRQAHNLSLIGELVAELPALYCDIGTAIQYGRLRQAMKARGRLIPENDIWIAALASQHSLAVMTRDQHFRLVPDLQVDFLGM